MQRLYAPLGVQSFIAIRKVRIRRCDDEDAMEMIGHDHEFVKLNRQASVLDLQPMISCDLTE
jgi:type IV secretory pathway TrbD component